ncbi:Exosome non-catalytic core component [Komagataella phaffii CBS 7435]|uniref:3'-5' exoribonuclease involved in rRNA processing n=2 Tax=Komagataella phaffii TaxID=460519 RepID=C4R4Z2_KOMPG|nr:3'-5' exoribonuclease involved in rRNA processing [Komagataella phaffii GS115]AOA63563.1 GQ67_03655T0 [Komagataella phaffii]CAH2449605.1 Exosome non-catalytic core component [Komagataella phaffii CBS 7435]AOA69092.1 GQ68_03627T0 [Komagataella phaffii GS115]CAY70628.1 3'-5' exoribonuclease involved in rRNA processing [Komagataella phaffii GS115]CCA39583.1 Exosome non-catalytic core component [Komagataella phaffii CBS 7435]
MTEIISIRKPLNPNADSDVESSDEEMLEASLAPKNNNQSIVTPGELITEDPIWMRGHGTYYLNEKTYSSVAGTISKVNKLLSVVPLRGRYQPETGDHVVGRITEVGPKRWKVDIGARQDAALMLGSVNLPGGVLRRKSESDELQMRNFLKEGDLLNAEVQSIFQDGSASLHTRSLKYGKLRNGYFVKVPSSLIIRQKNHLHELPGSITIIIGVNGYIWISKTLYQHQKSLPSTTGNNALDSTVSSAAAKSNSYTPGQGSVSITRLEEESSWEIYSDKNEPISVATKDTIARYANCVKALAKCDIGITETRIIAAYEASMVYENAGLLLDEETMKSIGEDVLNRERMRG